MSQSFEIAIIGAGPGGLGAAANCAAQGISHILFEKSELANTIYEYQLGKHVMAEPNSLPLRSQLPFQAGSRETLLELWQRLVEEKKINLNYAEVAGVEKSTEGFLINTAKDQYLVKSVVIAIGVQGSPRKLKVPGSELPHIGYTLSDPAAFQNQDVLVIGAGDAAIENALALSSANRVTILNRTAEFPRAKNANIKNILDAIASGQVNCLYDSEIAKIESNNMAVVTNADGEIGIPCTKIIARLGAIPPRGFLEKIGIIFPSKELSSLPVVNDRYETNVKGIYAIGALIGYPLIKQAINQGYEVVEHILGNIVEPADEPIIQEHLAKLKGDPSRKITDLQEKLPLFLNLAVPQFRELVSESQLHLLKAGEIVFKENDYTDTFFSIVEGSVIIELPNNKEVVLDNGNFFGEMSLFSGRRRSATVKVQSNCVLLETQRRQILKLIRSSPDVSKKLDQLFVFRALQTKIFPLAKAESIQKLLPKLSSKKFKKAEIIFNEGDIGDFFSIIKKGSVQISRKRKDGLDVLQAYIPAGNYFGEMSLIGSEPMPRTTTVRAAVECETLCLSRNDILDFLAENEESLKVMRRVADEHRVENALLEQSETKGGLLGFIFQQGITDADNVLIIDSDLCVGCDNCERACAATHEGTSRLDRKGGKSFASIQVPISCRHCENPLCMLDCPPDALRRHSNGEVVINDSCIGCGNCERNCPYGVIQMVYPQQTSWDKFLNIIGIKESDSHEAVVAKATKCDMCSKLSLGPACVRACPTGAAMRVSPKTIIDIVDSSE